MRCDNLPQLWEKFSQVTFPYKMVIKNHSVKIKGNPILFNCIQGFTQNFGIHKYWMQKIQKSWNKICDN